MAPHAEKTGSKLKEGLKKALSTNAFDALEYDVSLLLYMHFQAQKECRPFRGKSLDASLIDEGLAKLSAQATRKEPRWSMDGEVSRGSQEFSSSHVPMREEIFAEKAPSFPASVNGMATAPIARAPVAGRPSLPHPRFPFTAEDIVSRIPVEMFLDDTYISRICEELRAVHGAGWISYDEFLKILQGLAVRWTRVFKIMGIL